MYAFRVWISQDQRARRESNPQPSASKVWTIHRKAYLMVVNCWKINELRMETLAARRQELYQVASRLVQ
jgi:hypothetical protein